MDLRTSLATQSYATARSAAAPQVLGPDKAAPRPSDVATEFEQVLATGEATARSAMIGGADPHALVEALAASEMAVETVVAVRDKVVEAYQEILRMPI